MTHVWQVPVAGGPLAIDPSDLQVVEAAIMAQQQGLAPTTTGGSPASPGHADEQRLAAEPSDFETGSRLARSEEVDRRKGPGRCRATQDGGCSACGSALSLPPPAFGTVFSAKEVPWRAG